MSAIRDELEAILAEQVAHPVHARLAVEWDKPWDVNALPVRMGARSMTLGMGDVLDLVDERARLIDDEQRDPYRHGYEPAIWRETDWRLAELRVQKPGEPVILGVLGGNGGGKSRYVAHRFDVAMVENDGCLAIQLALDEDGSREVPQNYIYEYLPQEFRTGTGKLKKTVTAKLAYNKVNGFTDNTFGLPNGSRAMFKFYGGGDVNAMEGLRPWMVWADEMVPTDWVRASCRRLMTHAERSHEVVPALRRALAERAKILAVPPDQWQPGAMQAALDECWRVHLRPHLAKLFIGVCVVSFTPKNGYTRTVAMLTNDGVPLHEVEAELLPKTKDGVVIGYEKVPRVLLNDAENAIVVFFHTYDNPFGGNWEAQKKDLAKRSREERLWRAYGVATKIAGVQLPKLNRAAHVRPYLQMLREGTWYHIVDPCSDGRNWAMAWAKVSPNPAGDPIIWFHREWPQPNDWIEAGGVGNPGMWAVIEDGGKADGKKKSSENRTDGQRGPAQTNWGFGFEQYASEIKRVENELLKRERRIAGHADWEQSEGGIYIPSGCRIMDSRAANTETMLHGESLTLIQMMDDYGLRFYPAGRDSGAEAGQTHVREGVAMINHRLFYDEDNVELIELPGELTADGKPMMVYAFHGRGPTLFFSEECVNMLFCAQNWTGLGGGSNPLKDFIDLIRYLVIANPKHVPPRKPGSVGTVPWGA